MADRNLKAFSAHVEGMVQGVGFRFSALHTAGRLRISGYVQNLPDGSVKVVAEGEVQNLDRFRSWLKKGPLGSHVRHLSVVERPYSGFYKNFTIEY